MGLLAGKKGIIFGALDETSIAWKVAEACHAEGADVLLTNAPVALRFGKVKELAERLKTEIIPCDVVNEEDLNKLFDAAQARFGKVDFILHSIGMSLNVRKNREYTNLDYEFYHKTLDISGMSFHRVLQKAYERDAISEWGSVVGLSYIAAQRTFSKYNDMAESKALLESIARSFGFHYGKARKVRVNTVSQSPTPTTAGSGVKGFDKMLRYAEMMSPLGNATGEDCANVCLFLFSDLSRRITMQNIYSDGGFSSVGITDELIGLLGE